MQNEPYQQLVDDIARLPADVTEDSLNGWHIRRVRGGMNNRLFRALRDTDDLAIKFTRVDDRDRAGREYLALSVLQALLPGQAPLPVWIERSRYPQPVIVQTWLAGEASAQPPLDLADWQPLLAHLSAVHGVTPAAVADVGLGPLPAAILSLSTQLAARQYLQEQLALIPAQPPGDAVAVLERFARRRFADWPNPPLRLVRNDPALLNFIRRPQIWASVDWEYAGWGDPAFELGDLSTHMSFQAVPVQDWPAIFDLAARSYPDDAAFLRRAQYARLVMLVRWVLFFARMQVELDLNRPGSYLQKYPLEWRKGVPGEYARYLALANDSLNEGARQV